MKITKKIEWSDRDINSLNDIIEMSVTFRTYCNNMWCDCDCPFESICCNQIYKAEDFTDKIEEFLE